MIRRQALVSGRVQGVGYRASCAARARQLGVSGSARNLPDGRVEVVAQGPADAVAELLDWCRQGPRSAEVTAVAVAVLPPVDEPGAFRIG